MADETDRRPNTSKSTPRRTLGLRRIRTPRSVPLPSAKSTTETVDDDQISTPVARQRPQADHSAKAAKKLRLTDSPSRETEVADDDCSTETLKEDIERLRKTIDAAEKHEKKMKELRDTIHIWKTGALDALEELQTKIDPKQPAEVILDSLNIPHEIFNLKPLY